MKLLNASEAAALIRKSIWFVYARTNPSCPVDQQIPHRKLGASTVIIESELLEWVANGNATAPRQKKAKRRLAAVSG